jgi:hypothetical protein
MIEDYQESITAVLIDFWDYVVCTYMKGHFNSIYLGNFLKCLLNPAQWVVGVSLRPWCVLRRCGDLNYMHWHQLHLILTTGTFTNI